MSLELTVTESSSGSAFGAALSDSDNSLLLRLLYSSRLTRDDVSDRLGPSYSTLMRTRRVIFPRVILGPDRMDDDEETGRSSCTGEK